MLINIKYRLMYVYIYIYNEDFLKSSKFFQVRKFKKRIPQNFLRAPKYFFKSPKFCLYIYISIYLFRLTDSDRII
jgi:hypothetical protein